MKKLKLFKKIVKCFAEYQVKFSVGTIETNENYDSGIFEVELPAGTKNKEIFNCAEDVKLALNIKQLIPFKENSKIFIFFSCIDDKEFKPLIYMLKCEIPYNTKMALPVALGYDLRGNKIYMDLAEEMHIMYVGGTNTGKSMGLKCLILSMMVFRNARDVKLVIFDVGANSLDLFSDIPQLLFPIVKSIDKARNVIDMLLNELNRRIGLTDDELAQLPAIVVVIDEFAGLIDKAKNGSKKLPDTISNLLERGRKGKIHLVLASQDITKERTMINLSNIGAMITFGTLRNREAVSYMGKGGAEKLEGKGTMLFKSNSYPEPITVRGAYISDENAKMIVNNAKSIYSDYHNDFAIPEVNLSEVIEAEFKSLINSMPCKDTSLDNERELELSKIIVYVLSQETITKDKLKKEFRFGNRVNDIMDQLQEYGIVSGIVSEKDNNKARNVLPTCIDDISDEGRKLLNKHGCSDDIISAAIAKRNQQEQSIDIEN